MLSLPWVKRRRKAAVSVCIRRDKHTDELAKKNVAPKMGKSNVTTKKFGALVAFISWVGLNAVLAIN